MANTKSSQKRIRVSRKRALRNQRISTTAKTSVQNARKALILNKKKDADELVPKAIQSLDKASQKGVIHKNNAARKKSRLLKQYNKLGKK